METQTILELISSAYDIARSKGFFKPGHSDAEYIAAMHDELSEAFRAWNKHEGWLVIEPKPDGVYFELADAVIRVFSFCGYKGIDLKEYIFETDRDYIREDLCDVINRSHLTLSQYYENTLIEPEDDYRERILTKCIINLLSEFVARIDKYIEDTGNTTLEVLIRHKLDYNKSRDQKHGGKEV